MTTDSPDSAAGGAANGTARKDGVVDVRPLPEVMATLARARTSSRLAVRSPAGEREMIFVNGEVRAARSTVENEKLGSWLVQRGLITDDDMAFGLLSQVGETASPLGHLLVRRNLVAQDALERSLEDLAVTIVERASAETREHLDFHEGGTGEQPDTLLATSTPRLILAAARVVKDEKAKRRRVGSLDRPACLSGSLDAIMFDGSFTAAELAVIQRIEGALSLTELQWALRTEQASFACTLYGLVVAGYVQVGRAAVDAAIAAKQVGEKLVAAGPQPPSAVDPVSEVSRSEALLRVGNVTEALRCLERLCEADTSPEHQIRLARFIREHNTGARRILPILQRVLEANPKLVDAWVELARFWQHRRNPERRRKALTRALHLDPDNEEAKALLAEKE